MGGAALYDEGVRVGAPAGWGGGPLFRFEPEPERAVTRRGPRPPDRVLWPALASCLVVLGLVAAFFAGSLYGRQRAAARAWVFVENRGTRVLHVSVEGAGPVAVAPGRHVVLLCRPGNRYVWAESGGQVLAEGTRYLGEGSVNYFVLDTDAAEGP
jgi:hypothetical protein